MMKIVLMEKGNEMEYFTFQMVHIIQDNLKIIYQMEKVNYIMKMEILNMMEIMLMQIKKEMEFGIMKMVHNIKEHLSIIQEMEKGNYIIKMEI